MLQINGYFHFIQVSTLAAIALGFSSANQFALSEPLSSQQHIQETLILFNDPTPPSQGSPTGRQRGGASRGECKNFEALTALVPATNGIVWGKTASDRPTFWFYLPHLLTAQTPIEFVVQDADDNYVYHTLFTAPETRSGLINLPIPATIQSLEVGKTYFWTLSVYCDSTQPSQSVFVKGSIERVGLDSDLQNRLQEATPIERASLYAANGIWFEAIDTLAELYRSNWEDNSVATTWMSLLEQVKLESLGGVPFAPCCTVEQSDGDRE
jgi:hypothetical protein